MCDDCKEHEYIRKMADYISGLCDQFKVASNAPYEGSEPFIVGGPAGSFSLRSPYNVPNVQWKVDVASASGSDAIIVVSSDVNILVPGYLAGDQATTENAPLRGLLIYVPNNNTVPVNSEWYDLVDGSKAVFAKITKTTTAAYFNVRFRVKR